MPFHRKASWESNFSALTLTIHICHRSKLTLFLFRHPSSSYQTFHPVVHAVYHPEPELQPPHVGCVFLVMIISGCNIHFFSVRRSETINTGMLQKSSYNADYFNIFCVSFEYQESYSRFHGRSFQSSHPACDASTSFSMITLSVSELILIPTYASFPVLCVTVFPHRSYQVLYSGDISVQPARMCVSSIVSPRSRHANTSAASFPISCFAVISDRSVYKVEVFSL